LKAREFTNTQIKRRKRVTIPIADLSIQGRDALLSLTAVATLPAIAFLIVVHGTVLAALFAIRLVRRKRYRADRCRENGEQDLGVIFHTP